MIRKSRCGTACDKVCRRMAQRVFVLSGPGFVYCGGQSFPGIAMKRRTQCLVCGAVFIAERISQKYCSALCRRYAHRYGLNDHAAVSEGEPVLRAFHCVKCGQLIRITDSCDKRTKFCSARCERLYWKHSKKARSCAVDRTFYCRNCGVFVEVTEAKDRRTLFCSADCRKQWFSRRRRRTKPTDTEAYYRYMKRKLRESNA